MLDKSKWKQYGEPRKETVKGITIHNTNNSMSAKELEELMSNSSQHFATHFFIDENETIQIMPIDWICWHTGKAYDNGNRRTIAIEICRSTSNLETYMKAQSRAIELIRKLMKVYELSKDDIYFHSNFDDVYCPHRILDIYKNLKNFKGEI